jgi:predicted dehydrogenase
VWNPDVPPTVDYAAGWSEVPDAQDYDNAFKAEWELFIRHLFGEGEFPWDLRAGAKGVQLAELALRSWAERRWIDVPALED